MARRGGAAAVVVVLLAGGAAAKTLFPVRFGGGGGAEALAMSCSVPIPSSPVFSPSRRPLSCMAASASPESVSVSSPAPSTAGSPLRPFGLLRAQICEDCGPLRCRRIGAQEAAAGAAHGAGRWWVNELKQRKMINEEKDMPLVKWATPAARSSPADTMSAIERL